MVKKKTRKPSKPIGVGRIKGQKSFRIIFGTATKPRIGKKLFRSKAMAMKAAQKR